MIELFTKIPNELKIQIQNFIDDTLKQFGWIGGIKIIAEFANSCSSEEEQDFIDFYLTMKIEDSKNENNNDFS